MSPAQPMPMIHIGPLSRLELLFQISSRMTGLPSATLRAVGQCGSCQSISSFKIWPVDTWEVLLWHLLLRSTTRWLPLTRSATLLWPEEMTTTFLPWVSFHLPYLASRQRFQITTLPLFQPS
ncbi:hypothetical protein CSIM01_09716 [Colletotrichum simmondsii]|uniref:Uncharacterized protein n=1 Tax=Colletotrichum simmondsii TaxID=703756 RepID=A0A135TC26_9PEZI|nr:hypothetical protein CSIM01_09716 [Colletotrichum simmondsii]